MVKFGTNQGPIVPREPKSTAVQERSHTAPKNPAPISEDREDIPNPHLYKPLIPHQYRKKLYAFKPHPNLILGTPLDVKYTPSLQKYILHKKDLARSLSLGLEYTGPHQFDKQDYELYESKITLKPKIRYNKPIYYQPVDERYSDQGYNSKNVPQIGIIYSGGVRYYVPQIYYYKPQQKSYPSPKDENSVYDETDEKYYN